MKTSELQNFPNGTVIEYRRKLYWLSKGVEARVLTAQDGHWLFLHELKWKTCRVVFHPYAQG